MTEPPAAPLGLVLSFLFFFSCALFFIQAYFYGPEITRMSDRVEFSRPLIWWPWTGMLSCTHAYAEGYVALAHHTHVRGSGGEASSRGPEAQQTGGAGPAWNQ